MDVAGLARQEGVKNDDLQVTIQAGEPGRPVPRFAGTSPLRWRGVTGVPYPPLRGDFPTAVGKHCAPVPSQSLPIAMGTWDGVPYRPSATSPLRWGSFARRCLSKASPSQWGGGPKGRWGTPVTATNAFLAIGLNPLYINLHPLTSVELKNLIGVARVAATSPAELARQFSPMAKTTPAELKILIGVARADMALTAIGRFVRAWWPLGVTLAVCAWAAWKRFRKK